MGNSGETQCILYNLTIYEWEESVSRSGRVYVKCKNLVPFG